MALWRLAKGTSLVAVVGGALAVLPLLAQSRPPFPPTVFAVGDIMHCESPHGAEQTGLLMERLLNETPNSIGITLGDNSNDDGLPEQYDCLESTTWSRLRERVIPVPGNHDYGAEKLLPFYFSYFPRSGQPGHGYQAFTFGTWRVYALNSELTSPELRVAQLAWLERDLRANRTRCIMAYFHRPPFSSGQFASPAWSLPIFRKLYKYGADVITTGHEHFFAALPPLNPQGAIDRTYGIRTLIAGTGGAVFFDRPRALRFADSGETVIARSLGVLRLTLLDSSFEWAFVPVSGQTSQAPGAAACHDNPPGYAEPS